MITICPTITAEEPHGYRAQAERIEPFATRWHIDLADGILAPRQLIDPDKVWWPGNVQADLHLMYKNPTEYLDVLLALHPQLIIIHAEADGDFDHWAAALHDSGIEVGVALLPDTSPDYIASAIDKVDHVLIFSGNLGYQGGSRVDMNLLSKVQQLRSLKQTLEIGWDGGVNSENAAALAAGGVDVLNVGGFIHSAANPEDAYAKLKESVREKL
jgi:ribulose-phosphate 3-epimerase